MNLQKKHSIWILITTLFYLLASFGLSKLVSPEMWSGWIPDMFEGMLLLSKIQWTLLFGGLELILGFGLLFPLFRRYIALVASLHLAAIVISIGPLSEIATRDIVILAVAIYITIFEFSNTLLPTNCLCCTRNCHRNIHRI